MNVNYIPFEIDNLATIQKELHSRYVNMTNSVKLQTQKVDWTKENFSSIYDPIQLLANKFNVSVTTSRFFYTPPHVELEPHIDGNVITEKYWALNIPISVDNSNHYQEWFSYNGEILIDSNQVYANSIKPKEPEKLVSIDKLLLLAPHFVKVGTFHKVVNNSDKGRFVLSIRFTSSDFINTLG